MARLFHSRRKADPRYLLKKSLRVMALAIARFDAKAKSEEGLTGRDAEALTALVNSLLRVVSKADDDEAARARDVKSRSTDELRRALAAKQKSLEVDELPQE